jgi:hypothetical protein
MAVILFLILLPQLAVVEELPAAEELSVVMEDQAAAWASTTEIELGSAPPDRVTTVALVMDQEAEALELLDKVIREEVLD